LKYSLLNIRWLDTNAYCYTSNYTEHVSTLCGQNAGLRQAMHVVMPGL